MDTTENYNLPLPSPDASSAKADVQKISDALVLLDTALANFNTDVYIKTEIDAAIALAKQETNAQTKTELLGGVGEAFDTLKELADARGDNVNAITALTATVGQKADSSALKALAYLEQVPDNSITSEMLVPGAVPPVQGKNLLINGNFDIWQRGANQTSDDYGSDDRWLNRNSGSTKSHSQMIFTVGQTDVLNTPKHYSRTVVTSVAGVANYASKLQRIESVRTANGSDVTISFYAKADVGKDITVELKQNFGTSGSPSSDVLITPQKVSLTTSWQKFELTFSVPSISGKTLGTDDNDYLEVSFWFDAGSDYNARTSTLGQQSGTFDLAQVQLEIGDAATDFELRPISYELGLCQKYFEVWADGLALGTSIYMGGYALSPGGSAGTWQFKVRKRAIPTIVLAAGSGGLNTVSKDHLGVFSGVNTYSYINAGTTADAEL